jgi:F0F1-type ATP synthase assembly protein I
VADNNSPQWGKGLAQGLEVAVGAGLGYLIGHWLGHKYGWGPYGDFGGTMIGMAAGLYPLVRESVRSNKK